MTTTGFFDSYYKNAETNSILIMDCEGFVLEVNRAFTTNFGYSNEDISGKNFSLLFNEQDREKNKPQRELDTVTAKGQANDENYVIDKSGHAIWCTGEALLVADEAGKNYIVKDLVNLQAKKQLHLFLKDTEELLERIFLSSKEVPMMILDGSLKIQKVNPAFQQLFEIEEAPAAGSRLSELDHSFWKGEDVKNEVRQSLVTHSLLKDREYMLQTKSGEQKTILITSKIVERYSGAGRSLFIMVDDLTPAITGG